MTPSRSPGGGAGRFAPSPTGDLHLGSLVTAVGSFLHARSAGARWLLRMEDLDRDREVPGAAERIISTLDALGFEWDGSILQQSCRTEAYEEARRRLVRDGWAYPCSCTRADLGSAPRGPGGEPIYPGTCRSGPRSSALDPSFRFRTDRGEPEVIVADLLQGEFRQRVSTEVGDFVIRRRDGFHAYQLAVVVDDAAQDVTQVVRGCDLLDNTPRQILLQRALGVPTPAYAHLPLIVEPDGTKLAKRRRAVPVDPAHAARELVLALDLLRQAPPAALARATPRDVWAWALAHWRPAALTGVEQARAPRP